MSKTDNVKTTDRQSKNGGSQKKVVLIAAAVVLVAAVAFATTAYLKQKKENESTVAEQGSEYEQIVSEGVEYIESRDGLNYYEIDGDRYEFGATLQSFLDNGWEVAGSPDDTEWIYSEEDTVEGQDFVNIFLAKGEEFFQLSLLNKESEAAPYVDCIVNGFSVDENDFMEVENVTINDTPIWKLTVKEANDQFENQSEDSGECFYYYKVPENQCDLGSLKAIGWSIYAGSGSGTGNIDWLSFSLDYQFQ